MLKTSLNTTTIMPVYGSFQDDKKGLIEYFQTTMLVPVTHKLAISSVGSMPAEQIKAVMKQAFETASEVEIEYSADGRDAKGNIKYTVYSVKPLPKKQQ